MKDLCLKVLVLTSTVFLEGVVSQSDDSIDGCMPQLADRCFVGLMDLIPCGFKTGGECSDERIEFEKFCNVVNDALSCSSDIIDSDCSVADGTVTFDNWLKGLDAVREFFCSQDYQTMTVLAQNADCWNMTFFIDCVNKRAKIDHVVKLLQFMLDKNECIFLVGTASECNALAIMPHCKYTDNVLAMMAEAIHTFFSGAKCQWESQTCSGTNKFQLSFSTYLIIILLTVVTFF